MFVLITHYRQDYQLDYLKKICQIVVSLEHFSRKQKVARKAVTFHPRYTQEASRIYENPEPEPLYRSSACQLTASIEHEIGTRFTARRTICIKASLGYFYSMCDAIN